MGALSKKATERPIEHQLEVEVDLLKLNHRTSAHVEQVGLLAKERRHKAKTPGRSERSNDSSTVVLRQRPRSLNDRGPSTGDPSFGQARWMRWLGEHVRNHEKHIAGAVSAHKDAEQ